MPVVRTALALVALAVMVLAVWRVPAAEEPAMRPYDGGEVIAAIPAYFPPYYKTDDRGMPTGSAIDVMNAIAERLGLTVRYKVYDTWAEAQNAVKTGEAHLIPNIGDVPARRDVFKFTRPLEQFQVSYFALHKLAETFSSPENATRTIATTFSNVARGILERQGKYNLKLYNTSKQVIEAVLHGEADGLALPEPVVFEYLHEQGIGNKIIPYGEPLANVVRGIGVGKSHVTLFALLDGAVATFITTEEYDDIYRKWHGGQTESWSYAFLIILTFGLFVSFLLLFWLGYYLRVKYIRRDGVDAFLESSPLEQQLQIRTILLAGVSMLSIVTSVYVVLYLHYRIHLNEIGLAMQDAVKSQTALIEMLTSVPQQLPGQSPAVDKRSLTIARIRSATTAVKGMGEFVLAERAGDDINFLLRQRHWNPMTAVKISSHSNSSIPMQLALQGGSGMVVGKDYRNVNVLAAFGYIHALDLGIVYKVDLRDVQAPFYNMAIYGGLIAYAISLFGAISYFRIMTPAFRDIQIKEGQFRGIMDNSPAVIFISNVDGKPLEVNKAYCDAFNLSRDEILHAPESRELPEDVLDSFREQNHQVVSAAGPLDFEDNLIIDGEERMFLTKKFPIASPVRGIYAVGGISVDVTDLRGAERRLAKSEERFRAVFEQAAVGIATIGIDGTWLRVNGKLAEILGHSREDLLTNNVQDITHPDDHEESMARFICLAGGHSETYSLEKRYIRSDGRVVWVELTSSLVRNANGDPDYIISIFDDIDERIAAREEALRQRDRFQRYLNVAGSMIVVLDRKGNISHINRFACEVLGYQQEELIGHNWFEIALPDHIRGTVQEVADKISRGELEGVRTYENEVVTKHGERRLISWSNTFLDEKYGGGHTILATGIDVTEERNAINELQRTNRAMRTISRCNEVLVHSTQEPQLLKDICRVVVEDGGFALAWVAFIREDKQEKGKYFAAAGHYGVGEKIIDVCLKRVQDMNVFLEPHPTTIPDLHEYICAPESSEACNCPEYGLRSLCLFPLMREGDPFGGLFIASFDATSFDDAEIRLLSELAGDLSYGILSLRSERDRANAETDLRLIEERASLIVDSAHDAIISADKHGRITQFNPAAEAMFGYSREEIVGKLISDTIVPERFRESHQVNFMRFANSGERKLPGRSLEMFAIRRDGIEFPIEATISPLPGDTGDFCTAFIRDATDRYEADLQRRQAQNMESLGNLASGMAHDINNMLLPILNLTAMVRRSLKHDSAGATKLGMVEQAAQRIEGLVQTILDFSHQDAPHFKDCVLQDVLKSALHLIRQTTPASIEIVESLHSCPGIVNADEGQVTAALINLFSNAEDAIGGVVGRIEIQCKPFHPKIEDLNRNASFQEIDYAKISVTDDGMGMPAHVLERIFDPFFTTKEPGKGTGLGMSIVHNVIMKHGGALEVYSEPMKGTRVELFLPVVHSSSDPDGLNTEPAHAAGRNP